MSKSFRVYRANRENTGNAVEFQLSYKKDKEYDKYEMFLIGAKQNGANEDGNAIFDWSREKAITVKLGVADIGELMAVLEGRKPSVGTKGTLFHETPGGGNKVISFENGEYGYSLKISAQDQNKNSRKVNINLTDGEASVLLVLLKRGVEKIYGW